MTRREQSPAGSNTVVLRGRVTSAPTERELPSGDTILTLRVVVPRGRTPMSAKSKQKSDWVDCVAWGASAKRTVLRWQVGDTVEVEGALRRRFFKAESRPISRVEVEVLAARRVELAE
jgi:single-strand DNA-binding protein